MFSIFNHGWIRHSFCLFASNMGTDDTGPRQRSKLKTFSRLITAHNFTNKSICKKKKSKRNPVPTISSFRHWHNNYEKEGGGGVIDLTILSAHHKLDKTLSLAIRNSPVSYSWKKIKKKKTGQDQLGRAKTGNRRAQWQTHAIIRLLSSPSWILESSLSLSLSLLMMSWPT
jgi:hypothetical protein